ncbi:hypothetical protein lbkm_2788 [Lachnospiraceae bacterium KM106-2]|nr:hypothetical protein lbkm_2788 [Lachnospiraceae bacterium KM106-2]
MAKRSYKFTDKSHPIEGILSVIFGGFVTITLIALCYQSSAAAGKGASYIGLIGMLAFLLTIGGLSLGLISLKEKDVFYRFPVAGVVLNGILLVILFFVYIVGTII